MRYFYPNFILLLFVPFSNAERIEFSPENFQEVEPVKHYYISLNENTLQGCYSPESWITDKENGKIVCEKVIKQRPELPFDASHKFFFSQRTASPSAAIKVDNGYLVAYNMGEFGAGVRFFSEDGERSYRVSGDYVNRFRIFNGRVFGVGGLQHMRVLDCRVLEFKKGVFGWKCINSASLPHEGYDICYSEEGHYYILCEDCICILNEWVFPERSEPVYIKRGFESKNRITWEGWNPSTIQITEGKYSNGCTLYVGCDIGIVQLECIQDYFAPDFGEEKLYLPKGELYFFNQKDEKKPLEPKLRGPNPNN